MKILLVTDIHYGHDKYGKIDGNERVTLFGGHIGEHLRSLESIAQGCDLVMNLGDLIEQSSAEEDIVNYTEAVQLLDFDIPLNHVVGNHDLIFLKRPDIAGVIGKSLIYYSFDLGGYHHIVLDGNREGKMWPEPFCFDILQTQWFKDDLQSTQLPVIVYSHYPIAEYDLQDNPIFKNLDKGMVFPLNADIVRSIIEASGKVVAVLSGHMHFSHQQTTNGIMHYTTGSFSINNSFDKPALEYTIVTLDESGISFEKKSA